MMVQELQVLRCFSCETFQSHIVKKTNKWECKVCGAKQSVKKVYGRGSGKDCRIHTQKLNALRGQKEEIEGPNLESKEEIEPEPKRRQNSTTSSTSRPTEYGSKTTSKWAEFIDENSTNTSQNSCLEEDGSDYNTVFKTCKSKAQKRKIEDEFHNEVTETYPGANADKKTVLTSGQSARFTKKSKMNNFMFTNKSNDTSSSNSIGVNKSDCYTDKLDNKTIKRSKQNDSKCWGKWAGYLEVEEEENNPQDSSNITSETENISTGTDFCKSGNYLQDNNKWRSLNMISNNKGSSKSKSKNGLKNYSSLKYPFSEKEIYEARCSSKNLSDVNSKRAFSDSCDQKTAADSRNFVKTSVLSSSGKISEPSLKLCMDSVNQPHFYWKNNVHSVPETYNHVERTNVIEDFAVESVINKGESLKTKYVKESQEDSTNPFLPVFEQETDFSNVDFQLDF